MGARLDPTRPRKQVNAHPASDYLFSKKQLAKQDGQPLTGTLSGDGIEYYRHPKGRKGRLKGSVFNRLIAARPMHEAAVRLRADVLLDEPTLRARLTAHVADQRRHAATDAPGVAELEAERDELKAAIRSIVRTLKGAALADAQEELERLGARRNEVEAPLAQVRDIQQKDARPVEQVVDEAIALLADESRRLLTLAGEPLREAVNRLATGLTVDVETKEVEMTVALPVWATAAKPRPRKRAKMGDDEVCPATTPWSRAAGWTQTLWLVARCNYEWNRGSTVEPPCYRCSRRAA